MRLNSPGITFCKCFILLLVTCRSESQLLGPLMSLAGGLASNLNPFQGIASSLTGGLGSGGGRGSRFLSSLRGSPVPASFGHMPTGPMVPSPVTAPALPPFAGFGASSNLHYGQQMPMLSPEELADIMHSQSQHPPPMPDFDSHGFSGSSGPSPAAPPAPVPPPPAAASRYKQSYNSESTRNPAPNHQQPPVAPSYNHHQSSSNYNQNNNYNNQNNYNRPPQNQYRGHRDNEYNGNNNDDDNNSNSNEDDYRTNDDSDSNDYNAARPTSRRPSYPVSHQEHHQNNRNRGPYSNEEPGYDNDRDRDRERDRERDYNQFEPSSQPVRSNDYRGNRNENQPLRGYRNRNPSNDDRENSENSYSKPMNNNRPEPEGDRYSQGGFTPVSAAGGFDGPPERPAYLRQNTRPQPAGRPSQHYYNSMHNQRPRDERESDEADDDRESYGRSPSSSYGYYNREEYANDEADDSERRRRRRTNNPRH